MKPVQRDDAAMAWFDPEQFIVISTFRHWEDATGIGFQEDISRDFYVNVIRSHQAA